MGRELFLIMLVFFAPTVHAASPPQPACAEAFAQIVGGDPLLRSLDEAIRTQPETIFYQHSMTIRSGKAHIKIGELDAEHPEFLESLRNAVAAGKVAEIEVGIIVGPKVLNWILRLSDTVPSGQSMKMTGDFNMSRLMNRKKFEIDTQKLKQEAGEEVPTGEEWSFASRMRFDDAVSRLGIKKACRTIWKTDDLTKCNKLRFELRSDSLDSIQWSP